MADPKNILERLWEIRMRSLRDRGIEPSRFLLTESDYAVLVDEIGSLTCYASTVGNPGAIKMVYGIPVEVIKLVPTV